MLIKKTVTKNVNENENSAKKGVLGQTIFLYQFCNYSSCFKNYVWP